MRDCFAICLIYLFGRCNLITGDVEYDFAKNCRLDINKCGNSGIEYMENINKK
jgi:hypothetical protein